MNLFDNTDKVRFEFRVKYRLGLWDKIKFFQQILG
jgi:hypothetical protein